jgi:hypothetical protein
VYKDQGLTPFLHCKGGVKPPHSKGFAANYEAFSELCTPVLIIGGCLHNIFSLSKSVLPPQL